MPMQRKMFGSIIWSYNYTHYYFDPNAKTASANNDWIEQCGDFLKNGTVKCASSTKFMTGKTIKKHFLIWPLNVPKES